MRKCDQRVLCDHCGRPIRNAWTTITIDRISWTFHDDRRACRLARYEAWPTNRIDPPTHPDEVDDSVLVAALHAFDYVPLPWWMRWMPKQRLDRLRFDVAVTVGGIVERRIWVNTNGLEDIDG